MSTKEEIEQRMADLKWKALPPYERITRPRDKVTARKYRTRERLKELEWSLFTAKVTIALLAFLTVILAFFTSVSHDLIWFFVIALVVFLALSVELNKRVFYLKEIRFLKKLRREVGKR